jgi:hypothetical protein
MISRGLLLKGGDWDSVLPCWVIAGSAEPEALAVLVCDSSWSESSMTMIDGGRLIL